MRMLWVLGLAAVLAFPAGAGWSAEGDDAPKADAPAPYGDEANNLPLEVFKELKNLYDALRGAQAPDAEKITKGDAKKALAKQVPEKKEALVKALEASQVLHREFAAQVLGTWEDAEARKPALDSLHGALAKDPDANVRRAIARTLAMFKDANSRDALAKALDDKDVGVRALSVQALGDIKDPAVKDRLLRTLKEDDDATIRMRAAMALGKLNDKSTIDALVGARSAAGSGAASCVRPGLSIFCAQSPERRQMLPSFGPGTERSIGPDGRTPSPPQNLRLPSSTLHRPLHAPIVHQD